MWVCFWDLDSITLIYASAFSPVPYYLHYCSCTGSFEFGSISLAALFFFFFPHFFFHFFWTFYFYFILLYNTVLVLPYIDMNQPRVYMSSQSWNPSHLPLHIISLDHPHAPAPSILYSVSNLDWWFVSYMTVYMFQCHSPTSSHPLPLPQSPKVHSIHLCLFCCLTYRVIITIFLNSMHMY